MIASAAPAAQLVQSDLELQTLAESGIKRIVVCGGPLLNEARSNDLSTAEGFPSLR